MDTEEWQWATWFGVFATLAILTKGNGLALILVPVISIIITRKFQLLKTISFWIPLIIVLIFCTPWYLATLEMARNGMMSEEFSLKFVSLAVSFYPLQLVKTVGRVLFLLVVLGFSVRVIKPYLNRSIDGQWAAFAALLLSILIFHCLVPAGLEARHLITVVPILVIFLAVGIAYIAENLISQFTIQLKEIILIIMVLFIFFFETFLIPKNNFYGFKEIVNQLLTNSKFQHHVILVSSDTKGEGAFISEVAMRDKKKNYVVLRASKFLSKSRWNGKNYTIIYNNPDEIMHKLNSIPVGIIVIDQSIPEKNQFIHQKLLQKTLETYQKDWKLLRSFPLVRDGKRYPNALKVYSFQKCEGKREIIIQIDMDDMLGKVIEKRIRSQ